jgi:hypothetical protein
VARASKRSEKEAVRREVVARRVVMGGIWHRSLACLARESRQKGLSEAGHRAVRLAGLLGGMDAAAADGHLDRAGARLAHLEEAAARGAALDDQVPDPHGVACHRGSSPALRLALDSMASKLGTRDAGLG